MDPSRFLDGFKRAKMKTEPDHRSETGGSEMNVTTIGLDLAKQVFHLVGADTRGKQVVKKRLKRAAMLSYFANLPPCVVGIEACGGGHYWAREINRLGHEARLINPKFVKPYLRGDKNDYNDAAALCEAVAHPQMRFVPLKSESQQDLQALHRLREGLIRQRTVWINRARGLLAERGIVLGQGVAVFRRGVPSLLEAADNGLSIAFRELLAEMYAQVVWLEPSGQVVQCTVCPNRGGPMPCLTKSKGHYRHIVGI